MSSFTTDRLSQDMEPMQQTQSVSLGSYDDLASPYLGSTSPVQSSVAINAPSDPWISLGTQTHRGFTLEHSNSDPGFGPSSGLTASATGSVGTTSIPATGKMSDAQFNAFLQQAAGKLDAAPMPQGATNGGSAMQTVAQFIGSTAKPAAITGVIAKPFLQTFGTNNTLMQIDTLQGSKMVWTGGGPLGPNGNTIAGKAVNLFSKVGPYVGVAGGALSVMNYIHGLNTTMMPDKGKLGWTIGAVVNSAAVPLGIAGAATGLATIIGGNVAAGYAAATAASAAAAAATAAGTTAAAAGSAAAAGGAASAGGAAAFGGALHALSAAMLSGPGIAIGVGLVAVMIAVGMNRAAHYKSITDTEAVDLATTGAQYISNPGKTNNDPKYHQINTIFNGALTAMGISAQDMSSPSTRFTAVQKLEIRTMIAQKYGIPEVATCLNDLKEITTEAVNAAPAGQKQQVFDAYKQQMDDFMTPVIGSVSTPNPGKGQMIKDSSAKSQRDWERKGYSDLAASLGVSYTANYEDGDPTVHKH